MRRAKRKTGGERPTTERLDPDEAIELAGTHGSGAGF
jgi:hypothetical protein